MELSSSKHPPPSTHPLYVNLPATDGRWRNQQHVYFPCPLILTKLYHNWMSTRAHIF